MAWAKLETRQQDYTDIFVANLLAAASGDVTARMTAAREIATGHWGRAFASADITPDGPLADALRPHLGLIGRELVRCGEAVFEIAIDNGTLALLPCSSYSIAGFPEPSTWAYEVNLSGPSSMVTRTIQPDRILHLVYARSPVSPWKGISPIQASATTRNLLDNLELRLAQETGAAVGELIPVPNVKTTGQLQTDIRAMKGGVALVETTAQSWGAGQVSSPTGDYQIRRIGANPPVTLPRTTQTSGGKLLAACGLPVTLLGGGDGTASREGFRQFLHGTVMPVSIDLAHVIAKQFDTSISFSFDRLFASDLSGRARAFQSMVNGGLDVSKAAALAGLMVGQDG